MVTCGDDQGQVTGAPAAQTLPVPRGELGTRTCWVKIQIIWN